MLANADSSVTLLVRVQDAVAAGTAGVARGAGGCVVFAPGRCFTTVRCAVVAVITVECRSGNTGIVDAGFFSVTFVAIGALCIGVATAGDGSMDCRTGGGIAGIGGAGIAVVGVDIGAQIFILDFTFDALLGCGIDSRRAVALFARIDDSIPAGPAGVARGAGGKSGVGGTSSTTSRTSFSCVANPG